MKKLPNYFLNLSIARIKWMMFQTVKIRFQNKHNLNLPLNLALPKSSNKKQNSESKLTWNLIFIILICLDLIVNSEDKFSILNEKLGIITERLEKFDNLDEKMKLFVKSPSLLSIIYDFRGFLGIYTSKQDKINFNSVWFFIFQKDLNFQDVITQIFYAIYLYFIADLLMVKKTN